MTQSNSKDKKYEDFEKTRPVQLELFELDNIFTTKKKDYSGTIELYDMVPKYYHGDLEKIRTKDGFLKSLTRDFVYRNNNFTIRITPAQVETKDGEKSFYPSQREEIIEDVLRKFATDPNRNNFLDDRLSVRFTLYELWKELKNIKHSFHYGEIIEALNILRKCNIEIKTTNNRGKIMFSSSMFETFGVVDENNIKYSFSDSVDEPEDDNYSKKIVYFVRFNSLVSDSIKNGDWRLLNYTQSMRLRKSVSRWLFKRISHMFMYNKIELPYNIKLSTIIRDSGMTEYESLRFNFSQVQKCLDEMVEIGSLERYTVEKIFSEERKNKIADVKFLLYLSQSFISDLGLNYNIRNNDIKAIKANKKEKYEEQTFLFNDKKEITNNTNDNFRNEITELLKEYKLPTKEIDKIIDHKNKLNKSDKCIKINIKAAIDYIEKQRNQGKRCRVCAIITSSLNEDWGNTLIDGYEKKEDEEDLLTKANKYIETIENKDYKNISKKLLKSFEASIYLSWLIHLKFEGITKDTLILSCNNNFIIDTINKNYLNGVKRKVNNKYVWIKKGIKQIVEETKADIKNVEIVYKR